MTSERPLRVVRPTDEAQFVLPMADGTRLEVETDGPADAAVSVVFVHGYTLNLTSFRHQRAALEGATDVRRVFYDQRAWGGSERGPFGVKPTASLTQLAEDLAEVVATVPGRVVLVGHSMGGMVILELARLRPDLFGVKVKGNVLIATSASGKALDLHGLEPLVGRLGQPLLRTLHRGRRIVRLAGRTPYDLAALLFHDPRSRRADRRAFAQMVAKNDLDVLADYLGAMLAYDARSALEELGRTATIVIAGRTDPFTTVSVNREVADGIPDAELAIVPRAGHMVTFEEPKVVNDAILEIVERVRTR